MSYREELQNSPGYCDEDDRKLAIKHALTFFGSELISTPWENCDIDLRFKNDLSIGVDIERAKLTGEGDWWGIDNLHYSTNSGLKYKTINIAARKHHYWEEYNKKTGSYYPSFNKNYLMRLTTNRGCVVIISPEVILDKTKRQEVMFTPKETGYGKPEKFWCFEEKDVKTFLLQEDGSFKLKPYIKEDTNEFIRKSNMARHIREFHTRKNKTSQNILSGEV